MSVYIQKIFVVVSHTCMITKHMLQNSVRYCNTSSLYTDSTLIQSTCCIIFKSLSVWLKFLKHRIWCIFFTILLKKKNTPLKFNHIHVSFNYISSFLFPDSPHIRDWKVLYKFVCFNVFFMTINKTWNLAIHVF